MTKLILDIPNQEDLDFLLPLLSRLKIHFTIIQSPFTDELEIAKAISIIEQGCEMDSYGDALEYQLEGRKDRPFPFR